MFERLRRVIVESFVGAIALGWLLAQGVVRFVGTFTMPVTNWIVRSECCGLTGTPAPQIHFSLLDAFGELLRSFVLLLVWYVLLRWLYYRPLTNESSDPVPDHEQAA